MTPEVQERIRHISNGEIPEGYKKTKFGILPTDWKVVTIEECLERVEHPVDVQPDQMYTQIGIRSHGKGLFYKEPVSGAELGNKSVYWIEPDCFILNIVFAWEQAIARTTQAEVGMIGSHRFPMYKPVKDLVDIDYLVYFFQTKRGTDILEAASPGGAGRNRTLGQDRFLKSKIVLPSIAEQKRIVEVLSEQERSIDLKEKLTVNKLNNKNYLMQQLLTGAKRLTGFCKKWETQSLGKLFAERTETKCENLPLLAITGSRGVIPRSELDIKDNSSEDKSKYLRICKGDIGYNTMRMWQGVSAYSEFEGIVSPAYTILKPCDSINAKFFAYLFKLDSVVFMFYRHSQGLVDDTRNLKYDQFGKIKVRYPKDICEQNAIATVLSDIDREIELLQESIKLEKQKKKALMQLLLTGTVRVNNG